MGDEGKTWGSICETIEPYRMSLRGSTFRMSDNCLAVKVYGITSRNWTVQLVDQTTDGGSKFIGFGTCQNGTSSCIWWRWLKECEVKVWTGMIWLSIGSCKHGISWPTEWLLISQEGLCSMELVYLVRVEFDLILLVRCGGNTRF
jgi:hypothetical protein